MWNKLWFEKQCRQRSTEVPGEKPVPVPHFLRGLTRDRTQASEVRDRQTAAYAIARLSVRKLIRTYLKTQFVPRSKHFVSVIKASRFVLRIEKKHRCLLCSTCKSINTVWVHNVAFSVTTGLQRLP